MSHILSGAVIFAIMLACASLCVAQTAESNDHRDARMSWWREARFGMFIHWGIYSVPAGEWNGKRTTHIGEWIMHDLKIPVSDYAAFAKQFKPVKFDADAWAQLAQDAGMKYLVITAKHHDGFAMYDSKIDGYNIVDATPFKRDVIRELSAACAKHGIKFGVYYSQAQDWHHAGGATPGDKTWDKSQEGSFDEYIKNLAVPQVRELLANYPIDLLWWDTPFEMTPQRAAPLHELLKPYPNLITNDRLGGGFDGDTSTPEQHIPGTGYADGRDWETCMTMNDTWGYKSFDENWKSTETLLRNLIDIASKGGNYLLNVGPTAEGVIPQASQDRLKGMGAWLKLNGESIYGSGASPFKHYAFNGRVTVSGNRMFVHVFDWPGDGVRLIGLKTPIKSAKLLAGGDVVKFTQSSENGMPCITLARPAKVDPIATVVSLNLDVTPVIDPMSLLITPDGDGSIHLRAWEADVIGSTAHYESGWGLDNIGHWTDPKDYVAWDFATRDGGKYQVEVTFACTDEAAGSDYAISVGNATISGSVDSTGGWTHFKTATLGTIDVPGGAQKLTVKATKMPKSAVMNLKEVKLVPTR